MSEYKNIINELIAQEQKYQFDSFDSELALKIGLMLIEYAKDLNHKIAIDIELGQRRLFHYTSDGNAMKNDIDMERKKRMVMYSSHSSLWNHYMLKDANQSMWDKWHLNEADYAAVGGGFPIRIKGVEPVLGIITVSGFNHEEDHNSVVRILEKLLGGK